MLYKFLLDQWLSLDIYTRAFICKTIIRTSTLALVILYLWPYRFQILEILVPFAVDPKRQYHFLKKKIEMRIKKIIPPRVLQSLWWANFCIRGAWQMFKKSLKKK